jgi:hypothetical protein
MSTARLDRPGFESYEALFKTCGVIGVDPVEFAEAIRAHVQITRGETIMRVLTVDQAGSPIDCERRLLRKCRWISSLFVSFGMKWTPLDNAVGHTKTLLPAPVIGDHLRALAARYIGSSSC